MWQLVFHGSLLSLGLLGSTRSGTRTVRSYKPPPLMASWASLSDGAPRAKNLAALEELNASGDAVLWNTMKLSSRPVSLREVRNSNGKRYFHPVLLFK